MPAVWSGTGGGWGVALAPGPDAPSPDSATEPSRLLRSRVNCKDDEAERDATDMGRASAAGQMSLS